MTSDTHHLSRRDFLAGVTAAPLAVSFGARRQDGPPNDKIRLGIIGSGSRGTWIGKLFQEHGGYEIVALADYFRDRVDACGETLGVPDNRRFTTLSAYRELLEIADIDAVAVMSPPIFHPEQARAAVEAGKHVFLAKPVAVDVPGCNSISRSGALAREQGLTYLVDFQTRVDADYRAVVEHLDAGAMGDIVFGESTCHLGTLRDLTDPDKTALENRLRNWVFDQALSGDIIVEQHIHTLDVMNWIMARPPLRVVGTRGRKVRTNVGNTSDYYTLLYEYPDDVGITFTARQFDGHGTQPESIWNRFFCTQGEVVLTYGGPVKLRGARAHDGDTGPIFTEGCRTNIAAFHEAVTSGDAENPTVEPSVRSNLVSIMGRMAAGSEGVVTWEDVVRDRTVIDAGLDGLQA